MKRRARRDAWTGKARTCDGHDYLLRLLTPADAARERAFVAALSPTSRYLRFQHAIGHADAAPVPPLDRPGRRATSLAATLGRGEDERIIGLATLAAPPGSEQCEFAVAVADDWQCRGIGSTLVRRIIDVAAAQGYRTLYGSVLADNAGMIELARHLGLQVDEPVEGQDTVRVWRRLDPPAR